MATSTTTSSVDEWLQKFYQDNANNLSQQYDIAKNIYNANATPSTYTGPRVQEFTQDQLKGMQMVRDNVGLGQDALAGAAARAGNAAKSYSDSMPLTADTIRSFYNTYLGRDPEPGAIQAHLNGNTTIADLQKNIASSPEAQARMEAGYAPDLSKLQDGSFRPNAVQTENYNQALGNNVLSASQASASLIGDRTPQIGAGQQITGGGYRADQVRSQAIRPGTQVQGGTYSADSVQAQNIGAMQQLQNTKFDQDAAEQYLNPYTQTALRSTLDEMGRQNQIGQLADQGRAAKVGAFGGSRQAVVQAERDRNFGKAVADTTAKAYDQAYGQAQSQFNTDIARGLETGQFNVNTDLNRQTQNQQAGLTAAQANQQANAAASQFGLGQNLQAQTTNAANDLTRQQSNQATNLQGQLANQGANAAASQFGLGQNLTAQQTNAANELARQQSNQSAGLQSLGMDQQSANQIALANQQASNNMALANEANRQQVFGVNADTFFKNQQNSLAAQTQNQNMALQGYNANRDQFNTDQTRQLASGQLAGQLAPVIQSMGMQDANNILTTGGMQQQLGQQNLNYGYQDWLNQKAQPYENFGFLQSALGGTQYNPYQAQQTQTTNSSNPNGLAQAAGLASTALGVVGATGGFGSNGWLKTMWS